VTNQQCVHAVADPIARYVTIVRDQKERSTEIECLPLDPFRVERVHLAVSGDVATLARVTDPVRDRRTDSTLIALVGIRRIATVVEGVVNPVHVRVDAR